MQVVLQSVASKLDKNTFYHLANDISRVFENKAKVSVGISVDLHSEPHFQSAFDAKRNQKSVELRYLHYYFTWNVYVFSDATLSAPNP